jgi:hypothetical protein
MVGVVGSNPIVSTSFHQSLFQRDAEECRELAPRQEISPAEADSFAVARLRVTVEKEKQLRLLFLFPSPAARERVPERAGEGGATKTAGCYRPHPNPLPRCVRGSYH